MEQNRVEILNMFKEGTLTLEEAAELLGALSQPETEIALKDTRGRKQKTAAAEKLKSMSRCPFHLLNRSVR